VGQAYRGRRVPDLLRVSLKYHTSLLTPQNSSIFQACFEKLDTANNKPIAYFTIMPSQSNHNSTGRPNASAIQRVNRSAQILLQEPLPSQLDSESDWESDVESYVSTTSFMTKTKLPPSTVSEKTLGELFDLMKGPYLDVEPDYQREIVWAKPRMTALINSIMEEYCEYTGYKQRIMFLSLNPSVDGHVGNSLKYWTYL
jgi:hypothetical protein